MFLNYKKYFSLLSSPKNLGFSLVELLVALGAFAILASGVIYVVTNSYTNFYGRGDKQVLAEFAQEAVEAVRSIRENSWQYLEDNTGTNLGLTQVDGVWSFAGTSNTRGDFSRVITISDAQRDSGGNLVLSGGTADPLTKKITVTISAAGVEDYVLTSYLTSWANRVFEQSDWSGGIGAQYWSDETKVYSSTSMDGVSSSGALQLGLVPAGSTSWEWTNITDFASTSMNGNSYCSLVDDANNHWYLCGSGAPMWRMDITDIRTSGFPGSYTSVAGVANSYTAALNPIYPHMYLAGSSANITTISTSTTLLLKTYASGTTGLYAMAVSSDGTRLYVAGAGGSVFSLNVSLDGTLKCDNCVGNVPEKFGTGIIHNLYLDEANDALYFVGADNTYTFAKLDVSNPADLVYSYRYSNSVDIVSLEYLGLDTSVFPNQPRFLIGRSYVASGHEVAIFDDTGAALSLITGVDLSAYSGAKTINVKSVHYTNSEEAFVVAADTDGAPVAAIYVISGVTASIAVPTLAVAFYDNTTYGNLSLNYKLADYSNKFGGMFIGWTYAASSSRRQTFIEQSAVASGSSYAATGNMVSSAIDLGSTDQELHSITITQDVPSACADDALEVTLEAADNIGFTGASSQVFSSSTVSTFSTEIDSALSGKRWLRYQVDMANCSSGAETPTLYSVRLNYR